MRRLLLTLPLALAACGARSDLDIGPPPARPDAGSDAGSDAGPPPVCTADGEPCDDDADCCVGVCIGGACGACKAGEDAVLLAAEEDTWDTYGVVVDRTYVYWLSNADGGSVRRVDKLGGEPATLATGLGAIRNLVVDALSVYVTAESGVLAVPVDGGAPTLLAGNLPGGTFPWMLAQDEDAVYWTTFFSNSINRVPKQGGEPVVLATLSSDSNSTGIAVDGASVYWSSLIEETIQKVPKTGGPITHLADEHAWAMALDDDRIYFGDGCQGCGRIRSLRKDGGALDVLTDVESPLGVVIDEAFVYWAWYDGSGSGVRKVAKTGGEPADVAFQESTTMVAVDETCVYWLSFDGVVGKIHK